MTSEQTITSESTAVPPTDAAVLGRGLADRQLHWLAAARNRLLRRAGIARRQSIVELGCGWGQVGRELRHRAPGRVVTVDCHPLVFERPTDPAVEPLVADAHRLPLASGSCDLVFGQCVLLWVQQPAAMLAEAKRVLTPDGGVALMEPDYGGMMEHPADVSVRRIWLSALRRAGADPYMGRKLPAMLSELGMQVEVRFFDRLQPGDDARFDMLLELPLSAEETQHVHRARRAASQSGDAASVHLPFWLVYAELLSSPR